MACVPANYYIENQPSLANELLNTFKTTIKNVMIEKEVKQNFKNLKSHLLDLTSEAHDINAEIETIRDFIDSYYINDINLDEKILNKYSTMIDKLVDKLENILDQIEDKITVPQVKNILFNAYDELYSTAVNTNFVISQKIARAYLEDKSNISVLQEA